MGITLTLSEVSELKLDNESSLHGGQENLAGVMTHDKCQKDLNSAVSVSLLGMLDLEYGIW